MGFAGSFLPLLYIMKFLRLFTGCSLLAAASHAQTENWDTYMARMGGKPASVLVDMGLMSNAPDKLLPYLLVTGPRLDKCGPTGIPDTAEIARMEKILDLTGAFLSGVTAKKLAGTLTYNCERVNYYYIKDTIAVRNALNRMYTTHYPTYKYSLKIKHEPLWQTYRAFLYPDSMAAAWISTNKAILTMMDKGDNPDVPRDIEHTIFFKTDSTRKAMIAHARQHRYKVARVYDAPTVAFPYELTLSRFGAMVMDSIMAMESELRTVAKPLQGYYKGWDATRK